MTIRHLLSIYTDGFRHQTKLGKRLWLIVLIKLFIMFAVLKLFFFPNFLKSNFADNQERSEHILNTIINQPQHND